MMKKIAKYITNGNYQLAYDQLNKLNYSITLDNFSKDFASVKSIDKYCFLIYVLSIEQSSYFTILLCEFLMYADTFFFNIYPVIYFFIQQSLVNHPGDCKILQWVVDSFSNHPDSPFSQNEMSKYVKYLSQLKNK